MRVTKEPEERRQEIIETAMRLFYEKGAMRRPPLRISRRQSAWPRDCATATFHRRRRCLTARSISMPRHWPTGLLSACRQFKEGPLKEILGQCLWTREADGSVFYQVFHEADNKSFTTSFL